MNVDDYKIIQPGLPDAPGIYRFLDETNYPIYIGKAKSLKKRISSYFLKTQNSVKTERMVFTAKNIEFTVVDTEQDALLLENALIKKFQPRYNINLKDDKTYPYICIKKEPFPRVFLTRRIIRDGSEYMGPYTSVQRVYAMLEFFRDVFPLRNCTLNLSSKALDKSKYRVCLEYHIGHCKGPCQKLQTEADYNETIKQVRSILKGHINPVINYFTEQMEEASGKMHFEQAEILKQKVEALKQYQNKSTIVNPNIDNIDVFGFKKDKDVVYINYMKVVNGSIVQTKTLEFQEKIEEDDEQVLEFGIIELREMFSSSSNEIILPFAVESLGKNITITIPQRGDKLKLLELADKNLFYYIQAKKTILLAQQKVPPAQRILNTLKDDLRLNQLPRRIECFDNSNIQGTSPVASMVCFVNGKSAKKEYRHFHIKGVDGPDDFASMREIVYRRYKRVLDENLPLADLIIIDGGKGQLSAACESLDRLGLTGKVPVIGIAKKLEEIYYPDDSLPLYINKKSESLKLIQQIRNEAHRFAITFHRKVRDKNTLKSTLTQIDGIGLKTFEMLMKHFKSTKKLSMAPFEEIESCVGKSKAELVFDYLHAIK
jgi:excinuclease ABC subunit C